MFWGAFTARQPEENAAQIAEVFEMYRVGRIRPHVSSRYPLEESAAAIQELADRRAKGKVVVTV